MYKRQSVGEPSDWLISSHVDAQAVREKTGIELVTISMEEFFAEIEKHQVEENEYTRQLRQQPWPEAEMQKSLEIYGALKRICQKYQLAGVTVRCFDLLGPVKSTGCLASVSYTHLSTQFCDRILFLENGKIAEDGTHDQLMRKKGKYAEMFDIQSQYYQEGDVIDELENSLAGNL